MESTGQGSAVSRFVPFRSSVSWTPQPRRLASSSSTAHPWASPWQPVNHRKYTHACNFASLFHEDTSGISAESHVLDMEHFSPLKIRAQHMDTNAHLLFHKKRKFS